MKHINKYKIFESESSNDELDDCIDIIETFNDVDRDHEITNYVKGWYNESDVYIATSPEKETHKIGLSFLLKLKEKSPKAEATDEYFSFFEKLISKSKNLSYKLRRSCSKVKFNVTSTYVKFILVFDIIDSEKIKEARFNRVTKGIRNYLSNWEISKRIDVLKDTPNRNKLKEINGSTTTHERDSKGYIKKSQDIFKPIGEIVGDGSFQISLSVSDDIDRRNHTITLRVGSFKWKDWSREFKKIEPTTDQKKLIISIFVKKLKSIYDLKDEDYTIEVKGQKVILQLK